LFFGIGQLMFSFACIAQVGVGVFFFMGQGGVGAQAIGQGVWKQRPKQYFEEMAAEFNELLSYSGSSSSSSSSSSSKRLPSPPPS
jgi:hypothetical protein